MKLKVDRENWYHLTNLESTNFENKVDPSPSCELGGTYVYCLKMKNKK